MNASSEYNMKMGGKYHIKIQNKFLKIFQDVELHSLTFLEQFDIQSLKILCCENVEPSLINSSITQLDIQMCDIESIDGLQLENLLELNLQQNKLTQIQSIKKFINLQKMTISDNQLINLSGIETLKLLKFLNLSYCQIKDISILKNMSCLQELDVSRNREIDLQPLQFMTQQQGRQYYYFDIGVEYK
ncbi:CotH_kinase family protein [Hexamita inflata]|uniref:CotH_kinase family protein n=1 Tax=Hexamita inflata TaxID=28002 RepID=A0ABP1KY55_9EUKA